MMSQTYAKTLAVAVTKKTFKSAIFRPSGYSVSVRDDKLSNSIFKMKCNQGELAQSQNVSFIILKLYVNMQNAFLNSIPTSLTCKTLCIIK